MKVTNNPKMMNFTPTVQHILNFSDTGGKQTMNMKTSTTLPCLQYQANRQKIYEDHPIFNFHGV